MKYSLLFIEMAKERGLKQEWIDYCLCNAEYIEDCDDGTKHFCVKIAERDDRVLRVIVNIGSDPNVVVTAFFDRRLKGKV